jgi:predicted transposase YdaD
MADEKAHEEGKVEGIEEGKDSKEVEMVIKLHKKGKTDIEIADLLDLPLEKVQKIIKNYAESGNR